MVYETVITIKMFACFNILGTCIPNYYRQNGGSPVGGSPIGGCPKRSGPSFKVEQTTTDP